MSLIKYKNFNILEKMGVVNSTTFYIRRLTYIVLEEFYKFIEQTRGIGKENSDYIEYEIVVPYQEINSLLPSGKKGLEEYSNFPISEIIINLQLSKETVEKMKGNDYMVGGYAMPFAKGRELQATRFRNPIKQNTDHSISIYMGIELLYGPYFKRINFNHPHFENTKLFKKVESIISHELNHLYEFYKRRLSRGGKIRLAPTMASLTDNTYDDISSSIFKIWSENFLVHIYNSEPHEMNAQVQEANTYVKRMDLTKFKNSNIWKESQKMRYWSYKEFLSDLKEEIEYEKLDINSTIEKLKEIFLNDLEKWVIDLKESPTIKVDKLRNLSTDNFFVFFEKRIKESGNILTRRFLRLFSRKN